MTFRLIAGLMLLIVLPLLGFVPCWALVPEDLYDQSRISVSDLSPNGQFLLYSVSAYDQQLQRSVSQTLRRDLDSGQDLLIFAPEESSWGSVWRPDGGAIAYLHANEIGTRIWIMDADGGNRRQLETSESSYSSLTWSPDGKSLAWITGTEVGDYLGQPGQYIVADYLGYRHLRAGYREGNLGQLFVLKLDDGPSRRIVTAELDIRGLSWSPDSEELVFEAKSRQNMGKNLNTDLWRVWANGGPITQLTTNPGPDKKPKWLPNGKIACLSGDDPLWESAHLNITVMDAQDGDRGKLQLHATGYDNYYWNYYWDSDQFYILGTNKGCLDLVKVKGDKQQIITDGGHDFWSAAIAGDRVILSGTSQTSPSALYMVDLSAGTQQTPAVLIDPNENWVRRVALIEPEPFSVEVDGQTIEGWFYKPADMEPGEKVATVLSIHGGPEWMYGGYFLPEFHILPRFGYGVVIANPFGSTGYGMEFQKAIRGDWVDRPARQVLACLDLAIEQGWADPQRLAVMGGSYGGVLTAAITTQTNRFRAAACDRMFPENTAFWGTTDEKWFPEWEFFGKPWEPAAKEFYRRNSPFELVDLVKTPTLISQGMKDYRCLIAGGEMWFSALQSLEVPSRFIRFANEGHGIKGKADQVFYYNQLLNWFDHYVRGNQSSGLEPEENSTDE